MSRPLDGLPAASAQADPPTTPEAGAPRRVAERVNAAAASETASVDAPEQAASRIEEPVGTSLERRDETAGTLSATSTIDGAAASTVATTTTGSGMVGFPAAPATRTATTVTPQALPEAPGGTGAIGGAVFALLLVVGLILALAWLAKRMPGVAGSSNAALRVVGSLSLGPRERVVVVAVGDTQLLLSVGAGGTRTLHTLETPLPVTDAAPSPFATLLAQHFGKKA